MSECARAWHWLGLTFCGTILIPTWVVSGVILVWAYLAAARARVEHPTPLQNAFEYIWEFVGYFVGEGATPGEQGFLNGYLAALFLFVLFCNMIGLLPGFRSPTDTLNTDLALAVLTFLLVQAWALFSKHGGGLKRLLHGGVVLGSLMLPIAVIEEVAGPITLAMRLFGNILAADILITLLLQLLPLHTYLFGGFVAHVLWLAFSIFVSAIQAFIFMVLTLAYVGQATGAHH